MVGVDKYLAGKGDESMGWLVSVFEKIMAS